MNQLKTTKKTPKRTIVVRVPERVVESIPRGMNSNSLWAIRKGRGKQHPMNNRKNAKRFEPKMRIINAQGESFQRPKIRHTPLPGADYTTTYLVGGSSFATHTGVASGNALLATPTAEVPFVLTFSMADLPTPTPTGVFDQYRIEHIDVQMKPRWANGNPAVSPNNILPGLLVVADYDDDVGLTVSADAQQYDNVVRAQGYEGVSVSIVPAISPAIFAGAAFTGYAIEEATELWLDVASSGVEHYGVKGIIEALNTSSTQVVIWDVFAYYTVSYKHTR